MTAASSPQGGARPIAPFHGHVLRRLRDDTKLPPNVLTDGFTSYFKSKTAVVFSEEEVEEVVKAIQQGRLPAMWKTHRQHVASLRERHGSGVCPKCGGLLVERVAKTGANAGKAFLGCSTFPKCRYTRQTDEQRLSGSRYRDGNSGGNFNTLSELRPAM